MNLHSGGRKFFKAQNSTTLRDSNTIYSNIVATLEKLGQTTTFTANPTPTTGRGETRWR